MKYFIIIFFLIGNLPIFAQNITNPEDYIIIFNKNGKSINKVIYKPNLSHEPDSIDPLVVNDVLKSFTLKEDSAKVSQKLIGKWEFVDSKRVNGKEGNMSGSSFYDFKPDGGCIFTFYEDTLTGKWRMPDDKYGQLILEFDKPQLMIRDTVAIKYMDEETLKSLTFSAEMLSLNEVNGDQFKIVHTTSIDHNDIDSFQRIIFLIYKRRE